MKKFLLVIGIILIIGVIVFNRSCSSAVKKESSTVRFTELDKEIQDTLFAIWQNDEVKVTVDTVFYVKTKETWVIENTGPIDFIDFTNNYVLEHKRNILSYFITDIFDKVVTSKSKGWKHRFPRTVHEPIIIKGDKIYTPIVFYFFGVASKSEMDTCRFNVYTIKD